MSQSPEKHVLMTADTIGGVWTYALELSKALQPYNITVHLATMGRRLSSSQHEAARHINNLEIRESEYALEWMDNPWEDVDRAGQWLLNLEQEIQPDLIHLNNYAHGSLPWKAPGLVVGHSCVLSWWQAVKGENAPERWSEYEQRVREGLRQADYVVGVTCYMLDQLNQYYGPLSNCTFIYNARQKEDFYASRKEPLIFSMGRLWDEGKNISVLQKISDRLAWPVYVAGSGAPDNKENSNLLFLEQKAQPEIADWLSRASIYVMPARYEPFGLSILEAALSGCTLVLGDIPTLREVWGRAALYVNPNNPDELQSLLGSLIQNPSQRTQMARKARQRALYFTPQRFGEKYVRLYQRMWSGAATETDRAINQKVNS